MECVPVKSWSSFESLPCVYMYSVHRFERQHVCECMCPCAHAGKVLVRGGMGTVLISAVLPGTEESLWGNSTTAAVAVCCLFNIALTPTMQPASSYPRVSLFLLRSYASSGVWGS